MIISNITMLQIAIQKCSYFKCTPNACPTDTVMVTNKKNYLHYTAPACPTISGQPVESSGRFP